MISICIDCMALKNLSFVHQWCMTACLALMLTLVSTSERASADPIATWTSDYGVSISEVPTGSITGMFASFGGTTTNGSITGTGAVGESLQVPVGPGNTEALASAYAAVVSSLTGGNVDVTVRWDRTFTLAGAAAGWDAVFAGGFQNLRGTLTVSGAATNPSASVHAMAQIFPAVGIGPLLNFNYFKSIDTTNSDPASTSILNGATGGITLQNGSYDFKGLLEITASAGRISLVPPQAGSALADFLTTPPPPLPRDSYIVGLEAAPIPVVNPPVTVPEPPMLVPSIILAMISLGMTRNHWRTAAA